MKPTILIIDDDPMVCKQVALALKSDDWQTVTATSSLQGLELAKQDHPDLIVLDLMMPELDGYGVLIVPNGFVGVGIFSALTQLVAMGVLQAVGEMFETLP